MTPNKKYAFIFLLAAVLLFPRRTTVSSPYKKFVIGVILCTTFSLTIGNAVISEKIIETNDPPLKGKEHDKWPRTESYVKDFKPLKLGKIHLEKGTERLILKSNKIAGTQVMDFKMMPLKRVTEM